MIDRSLLEAYYDGKCTEEEARKVHQWLSDPANKSEVAEVLSRSWRETEDDEEPVAAVDFEGIFSHIIRNSSARNPSTDDKAIIGSLSGYSHSRNVRSFNMQKIAAGLVSILIMSVLGYKIYFEERYFIYSTGYNQTKVVKLPDGSEVTLNANSTIKYAYNFDESSEDNVAPREVYLSGEGFFNVKKRVGSNGSGVQFIVHANDVDVEVLGTRFNVSTRRGKTEIVLNYGNVRLGIEESGNRLTEVLMRPGELVEIGNTAEKFVKRTVNPDVHSSWRNNKLIFNNTRVKDILNLIEDNFGYEVVVHDKTLEKRLYTDTTPADNLGLLLSKLSVVYNLDITRTGKQIIIQGQN